MRNLLLLLLLLSGLSQVLAQKKTFKVVDAENGLPIPYASIILGPGKGTISNGEGYFSLSQESLSENGFKIS